MAHATENLGFFVGVNGQSDFISLLLQMRNDLGKVRSKQMSSVLWSCLRRKSCSQTSVRNRFPGQESLADIKFASVTTWLSSSLSQEHSPDYYHLTSVKSRMSSLYRHNSCSSWRK